MIPNWKQSASVVAPAAPPTPRQHDGFIVYFSHIANQVSTSLYLSYHSFAWGMVEPTDVPYTLHAVVEPYNSISAHELPKYFISASVSSAAATFVEAL